MRSIPELLATYNTVPDAPAVPWGATNSAVGGQSQLDIPAFIEQYINNPAYGGVNSASGKGYMPTLDQLALAAILNSQKKR